MPGTCGRIPLAGKNGAKRITEFDVSDIACQIGCVVPRGSAPGEFNPDDWMEPKEQRKVDDFIVYAVSAADQAIADFGWSAKTEDERARSGVLIGSGIGGLQGIERASILLQEKGPRRISPFFIPGRLINLAGGYVSIKHGIGDPPIAPLLQRARRAPTRFGDAACFIALDDADVMVAGGTESSGRRLGLAGFVACRALSTGFNDQPQRASRPTTATATAS